ncbi:protein CURVATURE THYLAKOID 1A, chloroplastic-like [Zingiber officinale]|uniref:protein CURVATURE THYLAKOID 1A, chloroplastic-like n=1 Tax=Zingiber officinale TaxID=94328 RepID=UPI001C4C0F4D|nr:protein CURVATURE THYLAKOID 1A, chloroplastic-like [Zingiber officinale]
MAAMALAASSPANALSWPRPPSAAQRATLFLLPPPPRRCFSSQPLHLPSSHSQEARPLSSLRVRASSSEDSSSVVGDDLLADLKEKWDALENKSTVLLYGGGALVALWLSSILVGAVNSVPLLPKIMELVGLGYTGWFVYRYLLFKESRKELANDIDVLKKKVAGTE